MVKAFFGGLMSNNPVVIGALLAGAVIALYMSMRGDGRRMRPR
jgi:hypothetical protein